MLNLKKVIALVCVFAMVLTTVAFGATYTDVTEDSAYYEAVETLNKLDIVTGYEDGTYKPEDGVTRAEMAALIARIQGYGETAKAGANTAFTDVPSSHWASGYIANAAGMGIINGYGDGTFGPEDPVLYEQAVKMVMATLGYTPFAEKNGGYPTGYLAAAQRYDVSLAVANAAVGQEANRGTVAQLLANALDTPLMIQSKWNTNGEVEYVIADGKASTYRTLMSENLGFVKIRGVVVENSTTVLGNGKDVDTTKAEIVVDVKDAYDTTNKKLRDEWSYDEDTDSWQFGKYRFLVGETDADDYIGRSVIMYVREVNDRFEILSIAVDSARNDELVIALDQYVTVDGTKVKYYKEGSSTPSNITIATDDNGTSTLDVVYNYNGVYGLSDLNALVLAGEEVCQFGGTITFVDNDTKNGYDVAFVELAKSAVVEEAAGDTVELKDAVARISKIVIDEDEEDEIIKITKDGVAVTPDELNEWDVLSIITDPAAADTVIVAEVVTNQVVGVVSASKSSNASYVEYAYKINDAWYDVVENAYGVATSSDLEVGMGGTFYIDKYGKIAAFNEDAALATGVAANYGWVLGFSAEESTFGGEGFEAYVQLLTADGVEVLTFKKNATVYLPGKVTEKVVAEDWTLNGNSFLPGGMTGTATISFADLAAAFGASDAYTFASTAKKLTGVGTAVKYSKTSNGLINTITLPDYDDKFVVNSKFGATGKYDAENGRFTNGGSYVDEDAVVFVIGDATNSFVSTVADLEDQKTYTFEGAYGKKGDNAGVIAVTAASAAATAETTGLAVIVSVSTTTNDDNDTVKELEYYFNGEIVSAKTSVDVVYTGITANGLSVGDIVKIKNTSKGITAIDKIVNFGDKAIRGTNGNVAAAVNTTNGEEDIVGGVVDTFAKTSGLVTFAGVAGDFKISTSGANVYVIEETNQGINIELGTAGDYTYFKNIYASDDVYFAAPKKNKMAYCGVTADITSKADAKKFADYVYVRTYEDKVEDVVIVKGADTIESKAIPATYKLTGITLDETASGVAAADLVDGDITVTRESATKFVVEGNFKNYTANAWQAGDFGPGVLPWPAEMVNGHFAPITLVVEGADDVEWLIRLENGDGSAAGRTLTRVVEGVTYTVEIINTGI